MLKKEEILDTIEHIKEERIDGDFLIEELIILDRIQTGMEQSRNGQLISMEDVLKQMKEW